MNPAQDDTQIINGPIAPQVGYTVIYSVTLSNGSVVTSTAGFGSVPGSNPQASEPRHLPSFM